MRPLEGTSIGCGAERGRRRTGVTHLGWGVIVGVIVALIVMLATSASAVAGSVAFTQAEPGDSPQIIIRPDGQKQMAALGSTRALLDGAALMAGRAGRSGQAASVDIFYDGLEGASPPWTVDGGPTWGVTTYRAAAGSRSAYCAGSSIPAPGPYANNMQAWMWTGPIDLSTVTAATLEYKFYLDCEPGFDGILALVSLNDADYYPVDDGYTGLWPWTKMEVDLTSVPNLGNVCGQSTVYVAFVFESDSSGVGEGAYVDEVRVTGTQAELKLASWTISGQPLVVPYNGTVAVSGTLRDKASGALLGGRAAELHYTYDPTDYDSWVSLGETYSATGQFTEGVAGLQRRTYFSWKFAGDAQYWWEWSGDLKIMARAKLAPPPIPKTVRRGTKVVAWGTLRPKHSAAANRVNHTKTQFQRFSNGKYRNVATLWARAYRNTASATQYKIVVSGFGKNGKWRVRAVHSDADHAKTTSAWRTFTVK